MANDAGLRRGDIVWVDWSPARGSEQAGRRPALIVQTDAANANPRYPNTIVVTLSTSGRDVPSHVAIEPTKENGLRERSFAKCEQVLTLSKDRLEERMGRAEDAVMTRINAALKQVLVLA